MLEHAGLKDAIVSVAQLQLLTSALAPLTMVQSFLCSGSQTDRLMQTKKRDQHGAGGAAN